MLALTKPLCRQGPDFTAPTGAEASRIQRGVGRHQSQSEAFGIAGAKPTPPKSREPQPVGASAKTCSGWAAVPPQPLGAPGPLVHPFSAFRTLAALSIVLHRHTTDLPHFDF